MQIGWVLGDHCLQLCGHHFTQFGSWSGAAKVVHPKVVEQPRRTFFASCFLTTSTTTTTITSVGTWERAHTRTHHNNSTAADPRWHNKLSQREHDQREHDQREHDKRCAIRPGGARRSTGGERTGTAECERGMDGHCEPEKWVRTWHRSSGPIARAPGVFFVFMCSFSVEVGQWVGHLPVH
jgi:hypothetical protein